MQLKSTGGINGASFDLVDQPDELFDIDIWNSLSIIYITIPRWPRNISWFALFFITWPLFALFPHLTFVCLLASDESVNWPACSGSDIIFVNFFTQAHFQNFENLPPKKRVNLDISNLKYDVFIHLIGIISQFSYVYAYFTHYQWVKHDLILSRTESNHVTWTWNTFTKWNFTQVIIIYTSAACDACDKYDLCSGWSSINAMVFLCNQQGLSVQTNFTWIGCKKLR